MRNRYLSGVSRWASPLYKQYYGVVVQAGKLVTDADLNITQDAILSALALRWGSETASGFYRLAGSAVDDLICLPATDPDFVSDTFWVKRSVGMIAGYPFLFADNEEDGKAITLQPSETGSNQSRTDFVFLEAWLQEIRVSPSRVWSLTLSTNLSDGNTVTLDYGTPVVLTARSSSPGAQEFQIGASTQNTLQNLAAAIADPANGLTSNFRALALNGSLRVYSEPGAVGNTYSITTSNSLALTITITQNGSDTAGKPDQIDVWFTGNHSATTTLGEDMFDEQIGAETTRRVQLQYRIRTVEGIDWQTQPSGFDQNLITAQGGESAPLANYPFVPADWQTLAGDSNAQNYRMVDPGLWVAGNGTALSAQELSTVDGFVYAIPLFMVGRQNNAIGTGGFDPNQNTAGGVRSDHAPFTQTHLYGTTIGVGESDRPDNRFCDVVYRDDIVDLRPTIGPQDWSQELRYQVQKLLDLQSAQYLFDSDVPGIMANGSGSLGTRPLFCDEIGRAGGTPPFSGNTGRGNLIRNFDQLARTFSSRPVVERVVIPVSLTSNPLGITVTQTNPGSLGWVAGDQISIDFGSLSGSLLSDWTGSTGYVGSNKVSDWWNPGTQILDLVGVKVDDGSYYAVSDNTAPIAWVEGVGSDAIGFEISANSDPSTGGVVINEDTAQAGGASQITLALSASAVDNEYYGYTVEILTGPGAGEVGVILSYVGATRVATVASPWGVPPDGTSTYCLRRVMIASAPFFDAGSPRSLLVELLVEYPGDAGLSATVAEPIQALTTSVYPYGPLYNESAGELPPDWTGAQVAIPAGQREVRVEYRAGDSLGWGLKAVYVVSETNQTIRLPERIWGDATNVALYQVTDQVSSNVVAIDTLTTEFGSSDRLLRLSGTLSGAQTLCEVLYYAQAPLPNSGANGMQLAIYYRGVPTQSLGTIQSGNDLPSSVEVDVLAVEPEMLTTQSGPYSAGLPYPYRGALEAIGANGVTDSDFGAVAQIEFLGQSFGTGSCWTPMPVRVWGASSMTLSQKTQDNNLRSGYELAEAYDPVTQESWGIAAFGNNLATPSAHKNAVFLLVSPKTDSDWWRANEVLLCVLSDYSVSAQNGIRTDSTTHMGVLYRPSRRFVLPIGQTR